LFLNVAIWKQYAAAKEVVNLLAKIFEHEIDIPVRLILKGLPCLCTALGCSRQVHKVTMAEQGVSQLVSVDLQMAERIREAIRARP
jgi:hypothetical protein